MVNDCDYYRFRIKQDADADTSEFAVRSFLAKISSNGQIVGHCNWRIRHAALATIGMAIFAGRDDFTKDKSLACDDQRAGLIDTELVAGINPCLIYYTAYYECTDNDPRRWLFILWRYARYVVRLPCASPFTQRRTRSTVRQCSLHLDISSFPRQRSSSSPVPTIHMIDTDYASNGADESTLWKAKLTDNRFFHLGGTWRKCKLAFWIESVECTKRVVF